MNFVILGVTNNIIYIRSMIKPFLEWLNENNSISIDVDDTTNDNDIIEIQFDGAEIPQKFKIKDGDMYTGERLTKKIKDTSIKNRINQAITSIKKLKNNVESDAMDRVVGKYSDKLEKDIKDNSIKIIKEADDDYKSLYEIIGKMQVGSDKFIKFDDIDLKKEILQKFWYPYHDEIKRVGKGEFLLPILFYDVEKNLINTKGDDKLLSPKRKGYSKQLELKSGNAPFDFKYDFPKPNDDASKWKELCAKSFIKYLLTRDVGKLYLIFFDNESKDLEPMGFWVLYCGETSNKTKIQWEEGVPKLLLNKIMKMSNVDNRGSMSMNKFHIFYNNKEKYPISFKISNKHKVKIKNG